MINTSEICISHYARIHSVRSKTTGKEYELNCKSYRCPRHNPSWLHKWRTILSRAVLDKPFDKIIVLTCADANVTPLQLWEARKKFNRMIRAGYGDYEYFSVLEFNTAKNLPHMHILSRNAFIPQNDLSGIWRKATTRAGITPSYVVWIEAPLTQKSGALYALKYALKDEEGGNQEIPDWWKGRKIQYSRHFFAKPARGYWQDYLVEQFGINDDEYEVVIKSDVEYLV